MSNVTYVDRASVKWHSAFDSYFIESKVGGDVDGGAELTIGAIEILAGSSVVTTNVDALLSLGIVEVIAASQTTTSSVPNADLTLGEDTELSSSIHIQTTETSFITLGVAEHLTSTSYVISNVDNVFTTGLIEVLGSSVSTTSHVDVELTLGVIELMTSQCDCSTQTSASMAVGDLEELTASSFIESQVSGYIILGVDEPLFGSAHVNQDTEAWLVLGKIEDLSASIDIISDTAGLITIGINELLASTTIVNTVATSLPLETGQPEEFSSSPLIQSNVNADLTLGQIERLSSTITFDYTTYRDSDDVIFTEDFVSVNNQGFAESSVDSANLTVGIVELLGSTIPIQSQISLIDLNIGQPEELSASANIVSSVSGFFIFGLTESLSSSIHIQSVVDNIFTIGHIELLSSTSIQVSKTPLAQLDLGQDEDLSGTSTVISNVVIPTLYIGIVELVSSTINANKTYYKDSDDVIFLTPPYVGLNEKGYAEVYIEIAELTLGQIETLTSTISIESQVSGFTIVGGVEGLSASIDITTEVEPNLTIGEIELLSSTVITTADTYSDMYIGNSEILSTGAVVQSNIYAVLSLGNLESLSGYSNIISNIEANLSVGVVEILASTVTNTADIISDLTIGNIEDISSTDGITTDVHGFLTLGVAENLSATNNIVSNVSILELELGGTEWIWATTGIITTNVDAILTVGNQEELSATSNFGVDIHSNLSLGIIEVLLGGNGIISTVSDSTLTTGIIEVLASSVFSISITASELTIGKVEELSATANIETHTSGFIITGTTEDLTGSINIQSKITTILTLGVMEHLYHTAHDINTNVSLATLDLGQPEDLAHTYYIFDTQVEGLLTLGVTEVLATSNPVVSLVSGTLEIGAVELIGGSSASVSDAGAELTLGIDEDLSATTNINTTSEASLILGVVELLSSTSIWTSDLIIDMYIGNTELLRADNLVNTNVTGILTLGVAEDLSSTASINTDLLIDIHLGIDEPINGGVLIESNVSNPELTIGGGESLSASVYIETEAYGLIATGIVEVLGATSMSNSLFISDLTIGGTELLDSSPLIQSVVEDSELTIGIIEDLASTSTVISYTVDGMLTLGISELLATSNFSISITDATLTLGIDEPLTASISVISVVDNDITIGHSEDLVANIGVISVVNNPELILGVNELLATSNFSNTVTDADLTLGHVEELSATCNCYSNVVDVPVIMGIKELLSSTVAPTTSFPLAELTLGVIEPLSATIHIQPYIEDVLNIGGDELLSSSPLIQSTVLNTIDLYIGSVENISGTAYIQSNVTGTWLYVPGQLEECTSTCHIQSVVGPSLMRTDDEILEGTSWVSTDVDAILTLGVIELTAGSVFSISIVAATIELGLANILAGDVIIQSETFIADLTLGDLEPLQCTSCYVNPVVYDSYLLIQGEELLASSIFSISISNAELTLGDIVPLSTCAHLGTSTTGFLQIPGALELLSGTIEVVSVINIEDFFINHTPLSAEVNINSFIDNEFTIGTFPEILSASAHCVHSVLNAPLLLIGKQEDLSASINVSSTIDALLIKDDTLDATISVISNVESILNVGLDPEELSATISFSTDTEVTLDKDDTLSSTVIAQSEITADLIGSTVWMYSWVEIESNVDTFIMLNGIIDLDSTILIDTNLEVDIFLGVETLLTGQSNTTTNVDAELMLGVVKLLATSVFSISITDAELTAKTAYFEGSVNIESIVEDTYLTGPEHLFGSSNIISIVNGNIVDGRVELVSAQEDITTIVNFPHLFVGIPEELSASVVILSTVDARLIDVEYIEGSSHSFSEVTAIDLTFGFYTGTANAISKTTSMLTVGKWTEMTSTATITSNVVPDLIIGHTELKTAAIFSISIAAAELTSSTIYLEGSSHSSTQLPDAYMTGPVHLSASVMGHLMMVGNIVDGRVELMSAREDIKTIAFSALDLGTIEVLESTSDSTTNIDSHILISNYYGEAHAETEVWAFLRMGVGENFESALCQSFSVVETTGLIINVQELSGTISSSSEAETTLSIDTVMRSTAIVTTDVIETDFIVGVATFMSSSANAVTIVNDSDLTIGIIEDLSSTAYIEPFVDGYIYMGIENPLRGDVYIQSLVDLESDLEIGDDCQLHSQCHVSLNIITPYMIRGKIEELTGTSSIETIHQPIDLLIGVVELLSATVMSNTVTDADCLIGIDTELTASLNIETNCSVTSLIIGIVEVLSSTIDCTTEADVSLLETKYFFTALSETITDVNAIDFVVGQQEHLSGSAHISSTSVARESIGRFEELRARNTFTTNVSGELEVGEAVQLTGTAAFTINMYDIELDLGWFTEELSGSVTFSHKVEPSFLNIGITEKLTVANTMSITITDASLDIGGAEILESTAISFVESNSDTLWLDIKHQGHAIVQSNVSSPTLEAGLMPEQLTGTVSFSHTVNVPTIYVGMSEVLKGSVQIITTIPDIDLDLGTNVEYLSGTVLIQSDLYCKHLKSNRGQDYKKRITAELQYWYDQAVTSYDLNKFTIPIPAYNEVYEGTFLQVLFSESPPEDTKYRYLYREVVEKELWPSAIRSRLMLDPENAQYFVADSDDPEICNQNIYNLQADDIVMMDRLLIYRIEPENATLGGINYDRLQSNLSKMIYIYLELKIEGDYSKYDNEALFSEKKSVLDSCYETYLTENIFKHVSSNGT